MYNVADIDPDELPSALSLIKASVIALVVGGGLLVTTVLPAEYGVDPTGLGTMMGLTALNTTPTADVEVLPSEGNLSGYTTKLFDLGVTSVWKSATPFRTDTMQLTLQPNEGAEIKAKMLVGERFVFSWRTDGGKVNFDMHGERPNAGNEFSSYWKGLAESAAHGAFEAPFEGTHGWYWENRGSRPVTISVTTGGYYKELYKP